MTMSLQDYKVGRDRGTLKIRKFGEVFELEKRKFDVHNGIEQPPERMTVMREAVLEQKADLEAQLAIANLLLSDMDAAAGSEVTAPPKV